MNKSQEKKSLVGQAYHEQQLERLQTLYDKKTFLFHLPKPYKIDFQNVESGRFYRQYRTLSLYAFIIFIGFAFFDKYLGHNHENLISILEYRYIGPILGGMILLLFIQSLSRYYNFFLFVLNLLLGLGFLSLLQLISQELDFIYFVSIFLVQSISFIFMRLKFSHVSVCAGFVFLIYIIAFILIETFLKPNGFLFTVFYGLTAFLALGWNLLLEYYARKQYLLHRKALFQAEVFGMINFKNQNRNEIDGLTGIYNRKKFDDILSVEWNRGKRTKDALSLLIIDVDNFKNYNQTCGHELGDKLLKEVAIAVSSFSRRASDLAARFGSDKFALLLPYTKLNEASSIAEWILKKVRELNPQDFGGQSEQISVSIGVACCFPVEENGSEYEVLLNRVDSVVDTAKKKGGNCVEIFQV